MIKSEDIDVVIQGAIDSNTVICAESVRKFLPYANIILSTWSRADASDVDYDVLHYEDDPGRNMITRLGNINREIVGRRGGCRECSRDYTLIMRSDSKIINLNFINWYESDLPDVSNGYNFLKERIVICSTGWFDNSIFFMCDWFFFGKREDIADMFDLEIAPDSLEEYPRRPGKRVPQFSSPHEYLAITWVKKHLPFFEYDYHEFSTSTYQQMWKQIIAGNFIMGGFYKDYGILNLKEPYYTNQLNNYSRFINGVNHLMLNAEYEDWANIMRETCHVDVHVTRRLKWKLARILVRIYRIIKPQRFGLS